MKLLTWVILAATTPGGDKKEAGDQEFLRGLIEQLVQWTGDSFSLRRHCEEPSSH